MFKKELLEEFLFLYCNLDTFPFTNYEDALINNFDVLDVPFTNYSKIAIGWLDCLKIEISENLLSLPIDEKLFYLKYLKNKVQLESSDFKDDPLIALLKSYRVETYNLDFNQNTDLKKLLNTSFKTISGDTDLLKFRDLHREYYRYLLNVERNIILDYVNYLIEKQGKSHQHPIKTYRDQVWFKFGKAFALGEMEKYYTLNDKNETILKEGYTAPSVAKALKNEGYTKYITATINNYPSDNKNSDKNIFNSREKMLKIISHCEEHKISIIPYYRERLPTE